MLQKRYFLYTLIVLVIWISYISAAKLPSYVIPCSKSASDFDDCALQHGQAAMEFFLKGDREYNVPVLNPLIIPSVDLDAGEFKIKINDLHVYGIDTVDLKKVKFDLDNNKIDFTIDFDHIALIGKYECDGKISVVPIKGQGNLNLTIVGFEIKYHVDYLLNEVNGDKYIAFPDDSTVDYKIKRAYFNLENLFEGNKQLGDATNKALNDEWETILESLKPAITRTIISIAQSIAGALTVKVPLKDIFLE